MLIIATTFIGSWMTGHDIAGLCAMRVIISLGWMGYFRITKEDSLKQRGFQGDIYDGGSPHNYFKCKLTKFIITMLSSRISVKVFVII